jgi:hypothetical protein
MSIKHKPKHVKIDKIGHKQIVFKQKTKFDWSRKYKCEHETITP